METTTTNELIERVSRLGRTRLQHVQRVADKVDAIHRARRDAPSRLHEPIAQWIATRFAEEQVGGVVAPALPKVNAGPGMKVVAGHVNELLDERKAVLVIARAQQADYEEARKRKDAQWLPEHNFATRVDEFLLGRCQTVYMPAPGPPMRVGRFLQLEERAAVVEWDDHRVKAGL